MAGKRKAEARRWFQQASYDLTAVRRNLQGQFYDTACFLAQQAGEKDLKSLLYYLGARRTALLTHSLLEMVQEAAKRLGVMADVLEQARDLDLHYIPSRNPNGRPSGYPHQFYGKKMADDALCAAERVGTATMGHYRDQGEGEILEPDQR